MHVRVGPGLLVTAAFIGPGTVLTASHAGAKFGGGLLWAVGVAVLAAIVLQEMAARLGLITRRDLAAVLVDTFPSPIARRVTIGLILSAILIGNAAYQAGNLTGASAGLAVLLGGHVSLWIVVVAVIAVGCLMSGAYRSLQRVLVILVVVMSGVFVVSACLVLPQLQTLPWSTFRPVLPEAGMWSVMALLGTTVVPYNLFLHARAVQEKWPDVARVEGNVSEARWDAALAIALGGVVTAAILLTSVATFHVSGVELTSLAQMADQLVPVAGAQAKMFFAFGLFAAGLTSAITAPLAAAYATAGCLGWGNDWKDRRFRATAIVVVAAGAAAAILAGGSPRSLILFAQGANGLLLPVIAVFLIIAMNQRRFLGNHVNGRWANLMGGLVVLLVVVLAGRKLYTLWFA